jgi:hypothetical protein
MDAKHHLLVFAYLQLLDLLSTWAFLQHGVEEANPLVTLVLNYPEPMAGLIGVKLLAFILGAYAEATGRIRALRTANWFFAALIVWNLLALINGGK